MFCTDQKLYILFVSSNFSFFTFLQYKLALRNTLTKLFADVEMKKKKLEERDVEERYLQLLNLFSHYNASNSPGSGRRNKKMQNRRRSRDKRNGNRSGMYVL